jgi:hypothetical protein
MKLALSSDVDLIGPWVCDRLDFPYRPGSFSAIGKIANGKIVAGVLFQCWNGVNITEHIAAEGNWADRTFLHAIFSYPFEYLGVKRITVSICESNKKSIALVEKMGFIIEARLRGATSAGDLLIYRMFREECKYLRGKYHGRYIQRLTSAATTTCDA